MHRSRFGLLTAILLAFSLLASTMAASAQSSPEASAEPATPQLPVTVTDADGNDVTVDDVSRIVSLNGNITEILFDLGLGDNVVAVDVTAFYPPQAAALPKIGYNRTLTAEGVLSFEPTLIIGNKEAGPEDVIQQLRDSGVPVVIFEYPNDPSGAADQIREVAEAVGLGDSGDALAAHVTDQLEAAKQIVESSSVEPRVAFLIIRGEGVQLMAGANSSADGIITAAGGINVGAEIGLQGYAPITPESMIEAAPDVIVVLQDGLAASGGVEGLLQIPGVSQTPAGENENILAFNDLYILGFGPRMGDAVYDFAVALHPDVDAQPVHPEWQGTDVTPLSTPTH
ncbi:MAG TPA: hemin ABC transporter substrate-binding protein [Thermomicrobiales bacterium]|nr:hemin ABC transporter substrate-binding protein [Thermomicrobiales bacterium]